MENNERKKCECQCHGITRERGTVLAECEHCASPSSGREWGKFGKFAETVLKGERRRIIEQIRGEIEADIRADERRKVGEEIRNIVTENAGDCSAIVYKVMDFLTKEK